MLNRARIDELAAILDDMQHVPLDERILMLIRKVKPHTGEEVFARSALYLAAAAGSSATAQSYTRQLVKGDGIFACTGIDAPSQDADTIASAMRVNSMRYIDSSAVMDSWADKASDITVSDRGWPWPIVFGEGDLFTLEVGGTSLSTVGVGLRGFHVDPLTAAVLRHVGELYVEGMNQTFAAAAVMSSSLPTRMFDSYKELTHITAKETLTGDAARSKLHVMVKGRNLLPGDDIIIPPLSTKKAGARVSISLRPGDTWDQLPRYTSAGAAGTAKLQITTLGRRRYREIC